MMNICESSGCPWWRDWTASLFFCCPDGMCSFCKPSFLQFNWGNFNLISLQDDQERTLLSSIATHSNNSELDNDRLNCCWLSVSALNFTFFWVFGALNSNGRMLKMRESSKWLSTGATATASSDFTMVAGAALTGAEQWATNSATAKLKERKKTRRQGGQLDSGINCGTDGRWSVESAIAMSSVTVTSVFLSFFLLYLELLVQLFCFTFFLIFFYLPSTTYCYVITVVVRDENTKNLHCSFIREEESWRVNFFFIRKT